MVVPFPVPFPEFPPHLSNSVPPLLRQQEAGLQERFRTRQGIYSCVLSARCFSVAYIFLHSPPPHMVSQRG